MQAQLVLVLVGVVVSLLSVIGAGWKGYDLGKESARAEMTSKVEAADKAAELVASRFETKLSELKIVNRTINKEVQREVQKTVYTDCRLPEGGQAVVNRAVDAANQWLPIDRRAADKVQQGSAGGQLSGDPASGRSDDGGVVAARH